MRRLGTALGLFALAAIGIIAGTLTPMSSASPAKAHGSVVITVVAKEFSFALSKQTVPVGTTVTFNVVNKGKISHNFLIAGKVTTMLKAGQSAKLVVKFATKGLFPYLGTVPGHAAAGMQGKFAVGVAAAKPTPTPTTTSAAPAPPVPPSTTTEALKGDPVAGKSVFLANGCAACHTLAAAGATGTLAPNLDLAKPSQSVVVAYVTSGATAGGVTMPQFNLSATDLANLAAFVYQASHS
jgi:mono/diheme cytochrome c family protein